MADRCNPDPAGADVDADAVAAGGGAAGTGASAAAEADAPCRVTVKALCAFVAKAGDLDLRFAPSPSALEGIEGHRLVAARRPATWQPEVPLAGRHGPLAVHGRADGYDPTGPRVEEIKTHRGPIERVKGNHRALAWAQALAYAHLLCVRDALPRIEVALVYLHLGSSRETVEVQVHDAPALAARFAALCDAYLRWSAQEAAHRRARDAALRALTFPLPAFRTGQRALAEATFRALRHRRWLLAEAATGIGKSLGTLFPALKACADAGLDKVFYLCAKTPGRAAALHALAQLQPRGGPRALRVLELTARDKACVHPDKACHGESCPLARGFYDRLGAARDDAAQALAAAGPAGRAPTEVLRETAAAHAVCPYHLQQEMVRWADVVVGDYHYYFDLTASLPALAREGEWRCAVLVDEAHNLVDRARAMHTVSLSATALRAALPHADGLAARTLRALVRRLRTVATEATADGAAYRALPLPAALTDAVARAAAAIGERLADEARPPPDPALLEAYFELLAFEALAERFDDAHSVFDVEVEGPAAAASAARRPLRQARATIRNVVPAPFVRPRLAAAHGAVLFSATLAPFDYPQDLLGLGDDAGDGGIGGGAGPVAPDGAARPAPPPRTVRLTVPPPFDAAQLRVCVTPDLSTRWRDRARAVPRIARVVDRVWRERPGNYLVFASSFELLERIADAHAALAPDVPAWRQQRAMGEAERAAFLERFAIGGRGVGFAVLGGAFGEAVDLPGSRLIGAFIATLGLPQVNPVNDAFAQRLQARFGRGHDYAYLYPGLRKVVQAAGRVVRTPEDTGTVVLLDDRFQRRDTRALLPAWWPAAVTLRAAIDDHRPADAPAPP